MTWLEHDETAASYNELRATGAEGIAVNGVRLDSRIAVRASGPALYVGGQAVKHPYKVEAIGNPEAIVKAFSMHGGLLDHFKAFGPAVTISRSPALHLPTVSSTPTFHFGKPD